MATYQTKIKALAHRMKTVLAHVGSNLDRLKLLAKQKQATKDVFVIAKKLRKINKNLTKKLKQTTAVNVPVATAVTVPATAVTVPPTTAVTIPVAAAVATAVTIPSATAVPIPAATSARVVLTDIEQETCLSVATNVQSRIQRMKRHTTEISNYCGRIKQEDVLAIMRQMNNELKKSLRLCKSMIQVLHTRDNIEVQMYCDLEKYKTQVNDEMEKQLMENKTCSICLTNERSIVFVPCGHIFCSNCAERASKCHYCRKNIRSRQQCFFN